jgi:hypothetical protein
MTRSRKLLIAGVAAGVERDDDEGAGEDGADGD